MGQSASKRRVYCLPHSVIPDEHHGHNSDHSSESNRSKSVHKIRGVKTFSKELESESDDQHCSIDDIDAVAEQKDTVTFLNPFISKDDDMEGKCIVCWDNPRGNMVFIPCRHAKCCCFCAKTLKQCPECDEPIFETIEIFV